MCIFNTPVEEVSTTRILVGRTAKERQLVVYQNYVRAEFSTKRSGRKDEAKLQAKQEALKSEPTPAMILPFPCTSEKDQIDLIDLSHAKFDEMFPELLACYPRLEKSQKNQDRSRASASRGALAVEKCGSYNVSIAKSIADLRRIDSAVFGLAANVDQLLAKHYSEGFGFGSLKHLFFISQKTNSL